MRRVWLLVVGCGLIVGCQTAVSPPSPLPLITPSFPPPSAAPTLTPPAVFTPLPASAPSPVPDTGWQRLQPGLERRIINLNDEAEQPFEGVYLLRLEPALFDFRIAYRPGQPQSLTAWQAETGALIVLNGGFFTEDYEATGVIVVDGQASGVSYGDFAGMLAITSESVELRWLAERPYAPAEPLQFALQSFPVLVKPGGQLGFPDEDGNPARRTVVGMDGDGRFLIILTRRGNFTLHQLSVWLIASDLELDIALNLDGGPSSGLILAEPREELPAFSPLPAIIAIRQKK